MTTVGVDVGARDLVVTVRHKGRFQKTKTFRNNHVGHKRIEALCAKYLKYGKVRVAMEATGVYYFDLALVLSDNTNLEIMVINPRATKAFASASMERNKTDKVDSQILASFAEKMEHDLWKRPSDSAIKLRYFSRMLHVFTTDKARASNHLHALKSFSGTPTLLIDLVQEEIRFFEEKISTLKNEALTTIDKDEKLKESFNLVRTIKGFGETSTIQLLAEVMLIPEGLTNRQWVAFAGLDPRHFQSGTSVNKKPRISKAGNRHLRKSLFMPALSASKNDVYVRKYFEHLLENRKLSRMQAIAAIMRKLLHAIHGMLLRREPFDNTRFFGQKIVG